MTAPESSPRSDPDSAWHHSLRLLLYGCILLAVGPGVTSMALISDAIASFGRKKSFHVEPVLAHPILTGIIILCVSLIVVTSFIYARVNPVYRVHRKYEAHYRDAYYAMHHAAFRNSLTSIDTHQEFHHLLTEYRHRDELRAHLTGLIEIEAMLKARHNPYQAGLIDYIALQRQDIAAYLKTPVDS